MAVVAKKKRAVQGAYVLVETKKYLEKNFGKSGMHSPTEWAGTILDEYVKLKKEGSSANKVAGKTDDESK